MTIKKITNSLKRKIKRKMLGVKKATYKNNPLASNWSNNAQLLQKRNNKKKLNWSKKAQKNGIIKKRKSNSKN